MRLLYLSSSPEDLKFINKFSGIFEHVTCVHSTLFSYFAKGRIDFVSTDHYICFNDRKISVNSSTLEEMGRFNIRAKLLNYEDVMLNSTGFWKIFQKLISKENFDLVMIPSGRMLSQKILTAISKEYSLKTVYIGYGNYPGKTFLDLYGTDFSSSLVGANIPEYTSEAPEVWAEKFINIKLLNPKPPQSKNKWVKKFLRIFRFLLCKFERLINISHDTNYKFLDVIKFISNTYVVKFSQRMNLEELDYIFFPCQLSNDAQLILNADFGNLRAIELASQEAKAKGLKLIIKLHPAETDSAHLKEITKLKEKLELEISDQNTYELLKNCKSIITINSTMGMEALAIGKKTMVLGNAVYSSWTTKQAINYFESILFEIDYFTDEKVSDDVWKKISERFRL